MHILALGISYRHASIGMLERMSFTDEDLVKAYRRAVDMEHLAECVILSTCNRVEAYAQVSSYHGGFLSLKRLLSESRDVDVDELAEPLYAHWEQDAADHLFSVSAGLDSMVLGEAQIQSQVRQALRQAQREGAAGPELTALFNAATRAGKRVRGETSLGKTPDAFVRMGADLAEELLRGLEGRRATVVGAGQIAGIAVSHLRRRGAGPIRVLNRSLERARALARVTSTEPGDLGSISEALARSDLLVSATGASGHIVTRRQIENAMAGRRGRSLVILDFAVPRDVDPDSALVEGVHLIDVATLGERITHDRIDTPHEIERARTVVGQEVRRWEIRRRTDKLGPLIRALRGRGEEVVARELERQSSRLDELTRDQREAVEELANRIVAKLLHDPIVGLKERSEPGTERIHARVVSELFGIDPAELE